MPRSIGKYEIQSVLGKGGMGVVYKALDPLIGRTVAIKTILSSDFGSDHELLARLRMEAQSAGRLTHPNIVTVFEFGEEAGLTYLVMEYIEGANLANVIASGVRIPLNSRLEMIIQIADGIGYAHDLGVTHRDIKPSNICLTKRGDPKILDFGLARFDSTRLTKTGMASGTLMYMSPERIRGESGPSDDVFALGAVSYEIITGRRAFPGSGYRETAKNIMSGEYPIPPSKVVDVPTNLDAVIAKAVAVDKHKRYATAGEFARAIREVQQSATFQRRAMLDQSSMQDSMQTVAIHFAAANPYTSPELAPTDAKRPVAAAPSVTPVTNTVTAVRVGKLDEEAIRQRTIEQMQPTVALNAPKFTATDTSSPVPTEPMTAPRIPIRKEAAAEASSFAPTEIVKTPDFLRDGEQSFFGRARTVVARMIEKTKSGGVKTLSGKTRTRANTLSTPLTTTTKSMKTEVVRKSALDAMPEPQVATTPLQKALLHGATAGLTIAVGAAGTASAASDIALLCVYAGAVMAWHFLLKNCGRISGLHATIIGLTLTIVAVVQGGVEGPRLATELEVGRLVAAQNAQLPAVVAPFASLLFAGWAAVGGASLVRSLLGALAILAVGWALWDRQRPQRSIGVITFPLLLIEGIVFARIEAVAAMLLVGAVVATWRRRYGIAAFLAVVATGMSITAVAALPVLYGAAWHMIVFLSAAGVTLVLPKLFWPASTAWSASLGTLAATSPILVFLNSRIAALLTEWGVIDVMNSISTALTTRAGTAPRPIVAAAVATFLLVVALFVIISIRAARAPGIDAAMADGMAILLLLCMVREPAAWLIVVPFAILGHRTLWLAVAICSPILLLAPADPKTALVVWGISLAIPVGAYLLLRLGKQVQPMVHAPELPS